MLHFSREKLHKSQIFQPTAMDFSFWEWSQ